MGLVASALLLATACSGDDGGDPTTAPTTVPSPTTSTTTAAPTTTAPPTTTAAPTTTLAPTTTVPPTTSVEDLKAQIAADYVAAHERLGALLAAPRLEGLEEELAAVTASGSEYEATIRERVADLVRLGDVVIPNDPPYNSVTVEAVTLEPDTEPRGAVLTVCWVNNLKQVTPAENSPVGEEILANGGELAARRFRVHVLEGRAGWLQDLNIGQYDEGYPGATACGERSA